MKTIKSTEITIPENRIRKTFDKAEIQKLADSIAEIGLIHLPILRNGNELVSGERRVRAMRLLINTQTQFKYTDILIDSEEIPYAPYEDLDETTAKEIELSENTIRVDVPWQERAAFTAQFHEVRKAADPTHTERKTAEQLPRSRSDLGEEQRVVAGRLALAKNLYRPAVRAAKTEIEATKILRKEMEAEFEAELRKRALKVKSKHTLIHGEAVEELKKLPDGKFDVIITDPPYGVNANKFAVNVKSATLTHNYKDDWDYASTLLVNLAAESIRITTEQAHLYLFCDFNRFQTIATLFVGHGWEVWPRPIIWFKHTGNLPKPDLGPKYVYECILYANKNLRPTTGLYHDVIDVPSNTIKQHAAEKPEEVYRNLLLRSIGAGAQVLDPFCGSGPVFPATAHYHSTATGIELDADLVAICQEKINAL